MVYFRSFIWALCIWDIPHQNRKKRIGLASSDRVYHHLFDCDHSRNLFDQDREEGAWLDHSYFNDFVLPHAAHLYFNRCHSFLSSGSFMMKGFFFYLLRRYTRNNNFLLMKGTVYHSICSN